MYSKQYAELLRLRLEVQRLDALAQSLGDQLHATQRVIEVAHDLDPHFMQRVHEIHAKRMQEEKKRI